MSDTTQRILRVRRTDALDAVPPFALLNIGLVKGSQKSLDIKIIATEGTASFVATVENDKINILKGKTYNDQGSDAEWSSILKRTLLHAPISDLDLDAASLEGLELVCSVPNTETLMLTWQRKKRTSTQILGTLSLDQTDEEEIDAFVWAGTAIEASDSFEDDLEHLRKQYIAEQATTAKLRKQLDELAKAKGEHEKELITKFAELLNSKKLKIRDQQRLLAGAKIDPQAPQATSAEDRISSSIMSRKRTAEENEVDEDEESDAFEDTSMKDVAETPEASEASEDDANDEKEPTPPPIKKTTVRRAIGGKKAAPSSINQKSPEKSVTKTSGGASSHKADLKDPSDEAATFENQPPPKRRELPFTRKADAASPRPTAAAEEEEEEEKGEEEAPVTRSQDLKSQAVVEDDSDTEEEL